MLGATVEPQYLFTLGFASTTEREHLGELLGKTFHDVIRDTNKGKLSR